MSCKAEIIVDEIDDAVYVPIQSVVRVGDQPIVYVPGKDGALEARPIKVGLDDKRMIHVTEGLAEGERVTLTPPLRDGDTRLAKERGGEQPTEPSDNDQAAPRQTTQTQQPASAG